LCWVALRLTQPTNYKLHTGVKTMPNNDLIQLSESEKQELENLRKETGKSQAKFAESANISLDDYQLDKVY
jgi:DNA-binding transcriptional regulator YiaG